MPEPTIELTDLEDLTNPDETFVMGTLRVAGVPHHVGFHEVEVDEAGRVTRVLSDAEHQVSTVLNISECYRPVPVEVAGRWWLVFADPYDR